MREGEVQEFTLEQLKHLVSERALRGETLLLNVGPQHPSTHGVLRLLVELDGETIVSVVPDIGYLHTGIEKTCESKTYTKIIPLTDRIDYLSPMSNNLAYVMAVEKLMGVEVPLRAQYIRVILTELQRIASHLVWLGTHALDIAAMSVFLYCFREREMILDIFEMVSGQRMMVSYFRVGGLWRDVPEGFEEAVRAFLKLMPARIDEYERLLKRNPLWLRRTKGVGVISPEDAIAWGVTGPSLRGSGVNYDVRKAQPYSSYDHFEFDVPLGENGDVYDRFMVRLEEMRQSLRIIDQALRRLPKGPYITPDRKVTPPPKEELAWSMEALIHHFKFWTEGFSPPPGEVYHAVESPRGEFGVYINSDGSPRPRRVHFRAPSFVNLQALPIMAKGCLVADLVAIIGSIDIVLGEVDR
ncbi:NADH dehydrogenase (quinone) subunit D [Thermoflexus sp.]|uniref:NADH dehydrogenase (quinone) subunit D n=1 Tax=Thermoflexus sp. TaxID=1969742 RepID=UPI0035E3FDCF